MYLALSTNYTLITANNVKSYALLIIHSINNSKSDCSIKKRLNSWFKEIKA
jgi:hypothetical protein